MSVTLHVADPIFEMCNFLDVAGNWELKTSLPRLQRSKVLRSSNASRIEYSIKSNMSLS